MSKPQQKENVSELLYCGFAKEYEGTQNFFKSGRRCTVDNLICFNWDGAEEQKTCPIRLHGRKYYTK